MTLWHRAVVWARICRKAWSMLGGARAADATDQQVTVSISIGGDERSVIAPRYDLTADAAVIDIARGVREITRPGDQYRTAEPDGTLETIVLAYAPRAPLRVTS